MTNLDYKKLGLKSGLEIHQQIAGRKLFCNCKAVVREDKPDFEIKRKMRATAGELGAIDIAARHEIEKKKYFIYQGYNGTTCLVETDSEPPHPMNAEALDVVLQVCKMLNCIVVDKVQVMRKTVVDGSNTSGFQRTSLVGMNGSLQTAEGKIEIETVCVEEDAAKIVERKAEYDVYNLSRLGIPLVEIATGPDIKSPQQAMDVAKKLGMILRSTGKVLRGIGTIRQDINVSIKHGARIEIKGAQELKILPVLIENEVKRQLALIELKDYVLKIKSFKLDENIYDVSDIFKKTQSKVIKSALQKKGVVKAIKVPGLAGWLGKETMPGKRFGSELSDYAKVKAGVGGLFHSDELPKYGITEKSIEETRKKLKCKKDDAFILIADNEKKVNSALKEVIRRIKLFEHGVIKEVRRANPDGTSSFMRPMPGAARMYPETDIPSIRITDEHLAEIKIPELLEEKKERFVELHKLGKDLAEALSRSGLSDFFEQCAGRFKNLKPAFIAETLISTPKQLRRKFKIEQQLTNKDYETVFDLLNKNKITKEVLEEIFPKLAKKEKVDFKKYQPLSEKELEKEIKKILAESIELGFNIIVSKAMGKLRGRAEAKKIIAMLKRLKAGR